MEVSNHPNVRFSPDQRICEVDFPSNFTLIWEKKNMSRTVLSCWNNHNHKNNHNHNRHQPTHPWKPPATAAVQCHRHSHHHHQGNQRRPAASTARSEARGSSPMRADPGCAVASANRCSRCTPGRSPTPGGRRLPGSGRAAVRPRGSSRVDPQGR